MDRVQSFRAHHRIRKAKQAAPEDVLTGQQAREYLGIGYNGLLALIRRGVVHTHQVTDFAPWRIPRAELDSEEVQELVRVLKKTGRCPAGRGSPESQNSQNSLFPSKPGILQVGVGMTIADHPLHRSPRAEFPHGAPTSGMTPSRRRG